MKCGVREVFINELGIDENSYSEDLTYNSIPEWDSASHMVIVVALEEKFDIELSSDDIVSMTAIPKIYAVLQSKGVPVDA